MTFTRSISIHHPRSRPRPTVNVTNPELVIASHQLERATTYPCTRYPKPDPTRSTSSTTSRSGREEGLTGQAISLNGPVTGTFDSTPAEGSPEVLLGFIGGSDRLRTSTNADGMCRQAKLVFRSDCV
jgi:hypothetical protein